MNLPHDCIIYRERCTTNRIIQSNQTNQFDQGAPSLIRRTALHEHESGQGSPSLRRLPDVAKQTFCTDLKYFGDGVVMCLVRSYAIFDALFSMIGYVFEAFQRFNMMLKLL